MKQAIASNTPQPMRILKIASCPTCSGKGTLTYHLGCSADNEINFRVVANNGGGFFSPEWVSLSAIQQALDTGPKPITSFVLYPLFRGRSVNTHAFLLAVLNSEGLLHLLEGKQKGYECINPNVFMAEVNKLISSDVSLKIEVVTSIKNSATPPKKTATSKA